MKQECCTEQCWFPCRWVLPAPTNCRSCCCPSPSHSSMQSEPWPCSASGRRSEEALHVSFWSCSFIPNHLPLQKPFVLIWYVLFPYQEKLGQAFSTDFFFFSSSEEAVLKRCLKMCCSRFCIFMQDELNAGFFFATLLFIYIYIKCIMKLNHTAQRLQFNGTHSPPVRGTTPLYTLWKIWIIILIIIKIQRKYSIFNKIVNIKQWILYLIRTSPFSSRRQSTKIYFLIWWTYNT